MDSKCIVFGCKNHSDQGSFIGDICKPCYKLITTGELSPQGTSFIFHQTQILDDYKQRYFVTKNELDQSRATIEKIRKVIVEPTRPFNCRGFNVVVGSLDD